MVLEEAKHYMRFTGLAEGERRDYCQCNSCGDVVIREYIPGGIGRGRTFNPCPCYLTKNDKKGYTVLESVDGPFDNG